MSYFNLIRSLRSASDHDYTHDYKDASHVSPNSWVYCLPRLFGLFAALGVSAFLFFDLDVYRYFLLPPSSGGYDTSHLVVVVRWTCFTLLSLLLFRLIAGHSIFWMLRDATRAFQRLLPDDRKRFPASSFLSLCLIGLTLLAMHLFVEWDIQNARKVTVQTPSQNWLISIYKRPGSTHAQWLVAAVSPFPTLRALLKPKEQSAEIIEATVHVERKPGAKQQFVFIAHDCTNPNADVSGQWLTLKASSQPVSSSFVITPSGKAIASQVRANDDSASCLKREGRFNWAVSEIIFDAAKVAGI